MHHSWAKTIAMAHREPWAAIGSKLVNANPKSGVSDAAFRINYGIYTRLVVPRGPTTMIPGQNAAYKRDVLLQYEPLLDDIMGADLLLQWKLQQDGYRMFHEPAVKMAHHNENTFASLAVGVFYWNWCFA